MEALRVEFDPELLSYEDLLQHVLRAKEGLARGLAQYKPAIWYHSSEQQAAAQRALPDVALAEASDWYDAEDHHQKLLERLKERDSEQDAYERWKARHT
mmetsp:Transcript_161479/g.518524  ORF Transcript_161479/g.518524 Transcript_161479/m.518524 type:complete len:99 (+) Transcript_161479:245-541(+)